MLKKNDLSQEWQNRLSVLDTRVDEMDPVGALIHVFPNREAVVWDDGTDYILTDLIFWWDYVDCDPSEMVKKRENILSLAPGWYQTSNISIWGGGLDINEELISAVA